jgi:hypothetical protein
MPPPSPQSCQQAVKYQKFSQTISYAPDFTVVNYRYLQKFPPNLEQISATGEKRVHHTQYKYTVHAFTWPLTWSFVAESSASGPQSGKAPYHSLIYISTYHWCVCRCTSCAMPRKLPKRRPSPSTRPKGPARISTTSHSTTRTSTFNRSVPPCSPSPRFF